MFVVHRDNVGKVSLVFLNIFPCIYVDCDRVTLTWIFRVSLIGVCEEIICMFIVVDGRNFIFSQCGHVFFLFFAR